MLIKLKFSKWAPITDIDFDLAEYIMCPIWDEVSFLIWRHIKRLTYSELENSGNSTRI